jgi:membrane protease YdiL (CAAX protease family)
MWKTVGPGPTRTGQAPSLVPDTAIFVGGALLQFLVVYWAVPALSRAWQVDTLAAWMMLSIPLIFLPVIGGGLLLLRHEPRDQAWQDRLWLRRPTGRDWGATLAALAVLAAGTGLTFLACNALGLDPNPPFARDLQPLTTDRAWAVALWLVYWPINILGENLVWRSIILPRMLARVGRWAWLLNAALWSVFHLAFGVGNFIVLLPLLVLVPLIAQWRRNAWPAVVLHAALSGPGFVALALGLP